MNKEFIPYEQALELKELGFDEKCLAYYRNNELYQEAGVCYINSDFEETLVWDEMLPNKNCSAPLYQQAFRWFREKYDLQYTIVWNKHYPDTPNEWNVRKNWKDEPIIPYGYGGMCKTYEEAELACLKRLIEIVKNNA